MKPLNVLMAGMLAVVVAPVWAGGLDQLHTFLANTKSAKVGFSQTVSAKPPKKPLEASGTFAFARPGKFRWVYEKPYYQLLVADGERLWVYDRDLNQVTVQKQGAALGASPAALLAGDNALDKNFTLADDGSRDGLDWVLARPRGESAFESVRLGLAGGQLRAMDIRDNFGQTTRLAFTAFDRAGGVDSSAFRFVPPKGADVVGE